MINAQSGLYSTLDEDIVEFFKTDSNGKIKFPHSKFT